MFMILSNHRQEGNPVIELTFYFASLFTLGALIVFVLRQKGSYFKSVKILFLTAFTLVALTILFDLITNYFVKTEEAVLYREIGDLSAALIASVVVEHAALTVYKGKREKVSWKVFFSQKLNLLSVSFKGYVISVLILTWIFSPWERQAVLNIFGKTAYILVYEYWFGLLLFGVVFFFAAYPCMLFALSSRKYKEKSVANALKWLGACWIGTCFALFSFHGLSPIVGLEAIEISFLLYILYFGIIAYFFKKTTILESFFEMPYPSIRVSGGETVFVTYTSKTDKMKMLSAYIREGLLNGSRVLYKYPDGEDEAVRKELREHGVDVEGYEKNGSLILMTLSQFYLSDGFFDQEKGIRFLSELKADSLKKGYTQLRDSVDVGDFSFLGENMGKYIEYLNDERWRSYLDEYVTELFAVNTEKVSEKLLSELTKVYTTTFTTRSIDLIGQVDVFSKALGLTHQQMAGKNILFEFDPASDYERIIQNFVTEALANAEPVAVFTRRGSTIHSALSKREAVRFLILTQRVSAPQVDTSTNEILLPANNSPLLLDALNKTLETCPQGNLSVVFDSLSDLVLFNGFEKTYGFVRYALEMLSSEKATSLFLFDPKAHDVKVSSGLRSLFNSQVTFGKEGLRIVRLSESMLKT